MIDKKSEKTADAGGGENVREKDGRGNHFHGSGFCSVVHGCGKKSGVD